MAEMIARISQEPHQLSEFSSRPETGSSGPEVESTVTFGDMYNNNTFTSSTPQVTHTSDAVNSCSNPQDLRDSKVGGTQMQSEIGNQQMKTIEFREG
jgi:hypothetical protein